MGHENRRWNNFQEGRGPERGEEGLQKRIPCEGEIKYNDMYVQNVMMIKSMLPKEECKTV